MNPDGKLLPDVAYGQHIQLGCRNHPGLLWSTKNISPIGCRTIFYNLRSDPKMGRECDCKLSSLYVIGPHPEEREDSQAAA